MLVQMGVICATLFELPYFIRRVAHVLARWDVERSALSAGDRSVRHGIVNRRMAAANGADDEARDVAAASAASALTVGPGVLASLPAAAAHAAEPEVDIGMNESPAEIAEGRAESADHARDAADFECCEFPRAVSDWGSSFADGSDGPSGGIFGFYGWIAYHPDAMLSASRLDAAFIDCWRDFEASELRDSGWHSAIHRREYERAAVNMNADGSRSPTCWIHRTYPQSLAQISVLVNQHAGFAVSKALFNFVRLPHKLAVRAVALPGLVYIAVSLLCACFFATRASNARERRFSYRDRVSSRLAAAIHTTQVVLFPGIVALYAALCLSPWIVWSVISSRCMDGLNGAPPASATAAEISAYRALEASGVHVHWCAGQFATPAIASLFASAPWLVWLVVGAWSLVIVAPSLHFLRAHATAHAAHYHPLRSLQWLLYRTLTKGLWHYYKLCFTVSVQFCYRNRTTCCYLGEWLIFPLFVAWTSWPLSIPFFIEPVAWAAVAVLSVLTLVLVFVARKLTQEHWCDDPLAA